VPAHQAQTESHTLLCAAGASGRDAGAWEADRRGAAGRLTLLAATLTFALAQHAGSVSAVSTIFGGGGGGADDLRFGLLQVCTTIYDSRLVPTFKRHKLVLRFQSCCERCNQS